MKRPPKSGADRRCLWCYLISIAWPVGPTLMGIWADQRGLAELPGLVFALLMTSGCVIGLYGWGLMSELAQRPSEKRPTYYGFLNHRRIRDLPFLYLFGLLCLLLMC